MRTDAVPLLPLNSPLLVVEDSNEDFEALQRFLKQSPLSIPIQRCTDGEQALSFLYRTGKYSHPSDVRHPQLILLDLNLPRMDGREVLRRIKQDANLKHIPIVVFTTSDNPKDVNYCYNYGVNSYIVKPIDFVLLKQSIEAFVNYWFKISTLPENPEK